MSNNQKYDNCQCFNTRNVCPHRNDELMKSFIGEITPIEGVYTILDFNKEGQVIGVEILFVKERNPNLLKELKVENLVHA